MFYWWGVPIQSNPKASQRKFDPTAKEQWKYLHYLLILKHSYSSCLTSYNAFGRSRISNKVVTRNKSWKSTTSTSNWVAWFDALNSADAWTFRVFTFSAASNKLHKKTMRDSHPSGLHKWTRDSNGQENWPLLDMEEKNKNNNNTSWYHWVTDADQSTCCSAAALQSTIVPHPLCLGFNSPDRHCDISHDGWTADWCTTTYGNMWIACLSWWPHWLEDRHWWFATMGTRNAQGFFFFF